MTMQQSPGLAFTQGYRTFYRPCKWRNPIEGTVLKENALLTALKFASCHWKKIISCVKIIDFRTFELWPIVYSSHSEDLSPMIDLPTSLIEVDLLLRKVYNLLCSIYQSQLLNWCVYNERYWNTLIHGYIDLSFQSSVGFCTVTRCHQRRCF